MALRVGGYGFPTSFLLRQQIQGQEMMVDNPKFGWRFFPRSIARSPTPIAISAKKAPGVFRIFLFGESAALGDPRPSYGVAHYLEVLLEDRLPGTRFEVIPAAMTAINSHVMRSIAQEFSQYDGDLWIVYAGNNEYIGPFGPNTVFGTAALPLPWVRLKLAVGETRIGQLLADLGEKLNAKKGKADWTGLKMFRENDLSPSDPRRQGVEHVFRQNVMDVVRAGLKSDVPVVLSTMASNLKDCAPFGSWRSPVLTPDTLAQWQKTYGAVASNSLQNDWTVAAEGCRQLLALDAQYAETHFRLGLCEEALGQFDAARKSFTAARDLDALPFRADSSLNRAVQNVVQQLASPRVTYVDAEKALSEASPSQLPGSDFFYEHVHLTPEGNYRLAVTLADSILPTLPASLTAKKTGAWADAEVCWEQLGLSQWNRYSMLEEISRRLSDAPYTGQFNNAQQRRQLFEKMAEVRQQMHPRNVVDVRAAFESAVKRRPDRFWIHQNFAEFLELSGNIEQASVEWGIVQKLLPQHHLAYFQSGRLLARLKKYEEARKALEESLRIRPDLAEAYLELGQTYAGQRKWEDALRQYAMAQQYRPDDPRIYLRRADVQAAQNQREEAIQSLREAVRIRPSYWEAHYLLGVELAMDNKFTEADAQFRDVIRLNPDHVMAHFNLAVALAKQSRFADAIREFEETLRRDPENRQAKQYLQALKSSMAPQNPAPVVRPPLLPGLKPNAP